MLMSIAEHREPLLTIAELSHILRVTPSRAYGLIRGGVITPVRLGRQIRIQPEIVKTLLAEGGRPLSGGWRRQRLQVEQTPK